MSREVGFLTVAKRVVLLCSIEMHYLKAAGKPNNLQEIDVAIGEPATNHQGPFASAQWRGTGKELPHMPDAYRYSIAE
jgi:hypothetical protein